MNLSELDAAFPTIVRYTGLLLTVVLVGFALAGYYVQASPGFVAAAGMILYKTVREAAKAPVNEGPPSKMTMSLGFPMPNPEYDKWLEEERRKRDG